MGWTSLNPAKSWVLKHPTHQRCCVPANFLAFSLWLWIFLCWLQCCMVNKIQKLGCWFKRHKYKWKKVCLKTSHPWMCVRMGHPNTVHATARKRRLEATSCFCEWSCKRRQGDVSTQTYPDEVSRFACLCSPVNSVIPVYCIAASYFSCIASSINQCSTLAVIFLSCLRPAAFPCSGFLSPPNPWLEQANFKWTLRFLDKIGMFEIREQLL